MTSRRRARAAGWWLGILVTVTFGSACSDQEPPDWLGSPATTPASTEPTGPPVLAGPGSAMFDGFVVPEGLRVLGAVFPSPSGIYRDVPPESSWHAPFLVDGDPRVAVDDFLDQAVAQGLQVRSDCNLQPGGVGCLADARRMVDGFEQEQISFSVRRDAEHQEGYISYVRWPPALYPEDRSPWGQAQTDRWTPATPLEFPAAEVALGELEVGEPFAAEQQTYDNPNVVLADGSQLVGPVVEDLCATGGFDALLYIPGDVEPVLADYSAQFSAWDWEDPEVERETIQGVDVIRMGIYESGGGNLSFEAVVGDDGSWATIERCND